MLDGPHLHYLLSSVQHSAIEDQSWYDRWFLMDLFFLGIIWIDLLLFLFVYLSLCQDGWTMNLFNFSMDGPTITFDRETAWMKGLWTVKRSWPLTTNWDTRRMETLQDSCLRDQETDHGKLEHKPPWSVILVSGAGTVPNDAWVRQRIGEVGRRLMHLVPAPAVRLMKRRVQSRPGVRQQNNSKKPNVVSRFVGLDSMSSWRHQPRTRFPAVERILSSKENWESREMS